MNRDLSKFELPKAEPDGLTKELFGRKCLSKTSKKRKMMENNIFSKMTAEEQDCLWMYMIFNHEKIKEKTEQWTKEAEKAGMTLTEYLKSINPLDKKESKDG